MTIYGVKRQMWFLFAAWVTLALVSALADTAQHRSFVLPLFIFTSVLVTLIATRKHRPRNYKFEWIRPGVVRSPRGFEVRISGSRVEYSEADHVISWGAPLGEVKLSEHGIIVWDSPFSEEPIEEQKKKEVAKAIKSAISYLQLVDAGKIRPKTP